MAIQTDNMGRWIAYVMALALAAGAGCVETDNGFHPCPEGREGCACVEGACATGLECREGQCVALTLDEMVVVDDMVSVPAGDFYMGCDYDKHAECSLLDGPGRTVFLDAYEIDRTEVTVGAYRLCMEEGACHAPTNEGPDDCFGHTQSVGHLNKPMNCITWQQAVDYCTWADKRLPTEAEWEKAAKGGCEMFGDCDVDNPTYPWGDRALSCELAVWWPNIGDDRSGCGLGEPHEVGTRPLGVSPYGALDMGGNVSEWTADWYDIDAHEFGDVVNPQGPTDGFERVVRGGSFISSSASRLTASSRTRAHPTEIDDYRGFRCVR